MPKHPSKTIALEVDATVYELLSVLGGTAEEVVGELIDHAQQGVYRPGSWERNWVCQAFGDDWTKLVEAGDPHGRSNAPMFERPRKKQVPA